LTVRRPDSVETAIALAALPAVHRVEGAVFALAAGHQPVVLRTAPVVGLCS